MRISQTSTFETSMGLQYDFTDFSMQVFQTGTTVSPVCPRINAWESDEDEVMKKTKLKTRSK